MNEIHHANYFPTYVRAGHAAAITAYTQRCAAITSTARDLFLAAKLSEAYLIFDGLLAA